MFLPQASDRVCSDPCPGPCSGCPDRIVCRCLKVTEGAIVEAIETLGLRTIKEVRQATGAGGGCTCCFPQVKALLDAQVPAKGAVAAAG